MMVLDLFAGAGGASLGLASLGLDPVGVDADRDACATHHAAGFATVRADLASYPWHHLAGRVDVLHGSPPCQPFSAAGDRRGDDDPRDGMPWMLRAVDELRPRLVTVENVPGLLAARHRRYFAAFITRLAVLGYRTIEYRVLNAADFGIPQTRLRLLIVAVADGHVRWPRRTHSEGGRRGLLPWRTMADALGWPDGWEVAQKRGAGMAARHGPRPARVATSAAPTVTDGTARRWTVIAPSPTVSTMGTRWVWERPATTIAADARVFPPGGHIAHDGRDNSRMVGRSEGALRVELDELAALQGFPSGYPFTGTRTSIARQIGNALPPPLLAAVIGANL